MSRDHTKPSRYNQQFFRDWGGPGPLIFGLIAVLLVFVGLYLAFTKTIPFVSPGYEVKATFANAVNIATKSPVRIAGVKVGDVQSVEGKGDNSTVTFTVDEEGRPIHEDAVATIRPRLFLEGNYFVDLDPGTPGSPTMDSGDTIPISNTQTSVQVDQILTTLQLPQRANLQKLLAGLGTGLNAKPTAAEDLTFEPMVQGLSGGEALNLAYRNGTTAARGTAVVSAAFLGEKPNDLGNLIRGLSRVTGKLNEREDDLPGFVENFNTFTGALAAESGNLQETIKLLGPTLQTARTSLASLNDSLPALRGFAIAITPGINEIPKTIRVVTPFTVQLKKLLTNKELGGLAKTLEQSTPASAKSIAQTLKFFPQLTNFGKCISHNLVPTGDEVISDGAHGNGQKSVNEFLYASTNVAGESQNFDGNGPYIRFQSGGGPLTVKTNDDAATLPTDKVLYARTESPTQGTSPAQGTMPPLDASKLCYTQDVAQLNGPAAGPGAANPTVYP
jgi:phospholipid/cholesterol/gamma-HCH transport system substrate-binding protein